MKSLPLLGSSLIVLAWSGLGCSSADSDPAGSLESSSAVQVDRGALPPLDSTPDSVEVAQGGMVEGNLNQSASVSGYGADGAGGASGVASQADVAVAPQPEPGGRFTGVGTNPYVMVDHDPLSTFATDVDTASYDLFRRDVELGGLPSADSVRLEEYVNFFHYDYPEVAFDAAQPFGIALAAAPSVLDETRTLLRVGIVGKTAAPNEKKLTNLVFLVDVSGSMRTSEKLGLVQQVLSQTLDLLDDGDTVSIVSYASDTRVRLEPTDVSDRAVIEQTISGLQA